MAETCRQIRAEAGASPISVGADAAAAGLLSVLPYNCGGRLESNADAAALVDKCTRPADRAPSAALEASW
jgi:hypothetical protein